MSDSEEIEKALKNLWLISGLKVSIYDTNFDQVASYPEKLSDFCEFVQKNAKARMQCVFNDRRAFEKIRNTGEIYVYKCMFGLYEAVCPLYRNGVHIGYLMMGQALENTEKAFQNSVLNALPYTGSEKSLKEKLSVLPSGEP